MRKQNIRKKLWLMSILLGMMVLSGCASKDWSKSDHEADKEKKIRDTKWKQHPTRSLLKKVEPDNTWETRRKTQQNYGNQEKTGRVIGVTNRP